MAETASDILIIGCGNELRCDDGLGPQLAAAVAERGWPGVRALCVQQLTPELAPVLADQRVVIFIDAAVGGEEVAITALEPATACQAFTHLTDPAGLLVLAQTLYGRSPRAWCVAVPGSEFGHGDKLSQVGVERFGKVLMEIEKLVAISRKASG